MSDITVLNKVLGVREREKQKAQKEQIQAENEFTKIATQLYELLKSKEQAEARLQDGLSEASSIADMKNMSLYIQTLINKIPSLQEKVQEARKKMEEKQAKLTQAHIEVKKIEKMIENRKSDLKLAEARKEKMLMDEISIRQYQVATQNR